MEEDKLTLAPAPVENTAGLSLGGAVPTVSVDPDIATDRALKARTAYPDLGIDTNSIIDRIKNGGEQGFREELANNADYNYRMKAAETVQNMAKSLGRPLNLVEARLAQDVLNRKRTDPDSVIEKGYAEKFMENLRQEAINNPDSELAKVFQDAPGQVEKDMNTGKDYFAKRQRIQTLAENADAASRNQSLFGDIVDQAKGLTGLYESFKLRGLSPNSSVISEGLGRNIEAQAKDWFHLPFDQFNTKLTAVANKLIQDNPGLAKYYLSALLEQSQSEQLMHSVLPALDLLTLAPTPEKALAKFYGQKPPPGFSNLLLDTIKGLTVNRNAVRQMMTDISKATPEAAASAVGNAKEAGVLQTVNSFINRMNGEGKPLTEELSRLQSIYRGATENIADFQKTRPSADFVGPMNVNQELYRSIGQETVNRVEDEMAKWGPRVFEEIQDAMKLDQVPQAFAVRDKVEKIIQAVSRDYPGWENAIHDMRFKPDGLGNLRSETYFGKNGFELFGSEREAQAAVNNNFNKFSNARLVQAEGPPQQIKSKITGRPGPEPVIRNGEDTGPKTGTWANKDHDVKVEILDEAPNKAPDGRMYQKVRFAGKESYVPADELKDIKGGAGFTRDKSDVFVGELDNAELKAATTGRDTYNKQTLYPDLGHTMEIDDRIPNNIDTKIVQKGAGWYIVHSTNVDLTSPEMRMALLSVSDAQTPMSAVNAFGGWLGKIRTPEDTLSRDQNVMRKIATYVPNTFIQTQKELLREIDKELPKWKIPGIKKNEVWNQWKSVMDYAMTVKDAETGLDGKLNFRSVGELGDLYLQKLNRVPSAAEVSASFRLKAFNEFGESFNLIREYNRLARLGSETWTFKTGDMSRETQAAYPYKEIRANGIIQHEFPTTGNVLVLGPREGTEQLAKAESLNASKFGETLREAVSKGHGTIVRLTDPTSFPFSRLQKVGDEMVHYVYQGVSESGVPMAQRDALDWNLLRVGRPARYDADHYVVQPNLHYSRLSENYSYLGDNTIAAFQIRAMSRDVANKFNEIRKLIGKDDLAGARAYHATTGLEQSFDEIHGWFKAGVNGEGLATPPRLNLQDDIVSVPHGKTSLDMGKDLERKYEGRFKDMTREYYGHLLDDRRDPFDVFTYKNAGSKDSPLYQKTPLKYVDPLTTLNRGMSRAINGMYLDTYKNMSIEHWIQEVKDHVTVPDKGLASAPEYWFYTLGAENHWKGGTPDIIKTNLLTANMQIRQFLGIQDKMDTWLHQTAQTIADSIYGYKPEWALLPNYLLPATRDPFAFVRGMAFHAKMGLFAIPQLLVQASTYAAIFGIAGPDKASAGAKAAMFHMWTRVNKSPEILDHIDGLVANNLVPGSRFLTGQWKEAHDLLIRSGFEKVGMEHMFRDSTHYYDFFGSKLQGFMDAGSWFFREGERQVRTGAFYTAYREVRDQLSHTGPLTAAEERAVLQRADLLSINMSRASASMIHKGVFSVPTQFMSYTLRMAELVYSNRLTSLEKARLFGTYATLYGVPAAFGLSGLPIGDVINKTALENGYVPGSPENTFLNNAITEGLPAVGLALVSGNWYNVAERYANPGGISVVKDMIRGDKSFLETILGAPFSIAANVIGAKDPFIQMTLSAIKGDGAFKPKIEDFTDIFKEVNSAFSGLRLIAAMNTHRWLSKNEGFLSEVSTPNAFFMTVVGLSPRELSDIGNMQWTKEQEKTSQNAGIQKFIEESRRSYREREKGNVEQADDYQRRAWRWMVAMGVPPDRYAEAVAMAAQGEYTSMLNRTKDEYYSKHLPPATEEVRRKAGDQTRQIRYGNQ